MYGYEVERIAKGLTGALLGIAQSIQNLADAYSQNTQAYYSLRQEVRNAIKAIPKDSDK